MLCNTQAPRQIKLVEVSPMSKSSYALFSGIQRSPKFDIRVKQQELSYFFFNAALRSAVCQPLHIRADLLKEVNDQRKEMHVGGWQHRKAHEN